MTIGNAGIRLEEIDNGPCPNCGGEIPPGNNTSYLFAAYKALIQGVDPASALVGFAESPMNILAALPFDILPRGECKGMIPDLSDESLAGLLRLKEGEASNPSPGLIQKLREAYEIIQLIEPY